VTEPAGVPAPGATAATVAVNLTDCPYTEGLTEETAAVVEAALLTVWVNAAEVLPKNAPSPPYAALIGWLPTGSADVLNIATPPLSGTVPSVVDPSLKLTEPVGVPVAGAMAVTAAVNVTL
jgi:hypothetical protein